LGQPGDPRPRHLSAGGHGGGAGGPALYGRRSSSAAPVPGSPPGRHSMAGGPPGWHSMAGSAPGPALLRGCTLWSALYGRQSSGAGTLWPAVLQRGAGSRQSSGAGTLWPAVLQCGAGAWQSSRPALYGRRPPARRRRLAVLQGGTLWPAVLQAALYGPTRASTAGRASRRAPPCWRTAAATPARSPPLAARPPASCSLMLVGGRWAPKPRSPPPRSPTPASTAGRASGAPSSPPAAPRGGCVAAGWGRGSRRPRGTPPARCRGGVGGGRCPPAAARVLL